MRNASQDWVRCISINKTPSHRVGVLVHGKPLARGHLLSANLLSNIHWINIVSLTIFSKYYLLLKEALGLTCMGAAPALLYPFLGIPGFIMFQMTSLYYEINVTGLTCTGMRSSFSYLFLVQDSFKIST